MVFLKVNDIKIPFYTLLTPFNFTYNIFNSRNNDFEGEFFIKNIITDKLIEPIEINCLSILNDKNNYEFKIEGFRSIFNSYNKKEGLSIVLKYENIFDFYESFIIELQNIFGKPTQSYDCFKTSYQCNLKCPYCFQDSTHQSRLIFHEWYDIFIKKVIDINFKNIDLKYHSIRMMGGEPLFNYKHFLHTLYTIQKIFNYFEKKIDNLWIYTNYTINVKKFLNDIDNILKIVNHITIVITSDSLDYKNSLRIKDEKTMNVYKDNIINTSKYLNNNSKITLATNLMYLDKINCFNTAYELYNLGVTYIQIAYNEFLIDSEEYSKICKDITEIFDKLQTMGIQRLKPNLGNTLWVHFMINDLNGDIYNSKLNFKTDYPITMMNDY